jgi:adenylate cyclase
MTNGFACEAIVSDEIFITADLPADALPKQQVEIRGRSEAMIVRTVTSTKTLSALVNDIEIAAA